MATQTTSKGNPRDSMVSTWRDGDRSQWTASHRLLDLLGTRLIPRDGKVPVHAKTEKVPSVREWTVHLWILLHALIPLALHQIYIAYTGRPLHPVAVFFWYNTAFYGTGIHLTQTIRRLGGVYGFLDGDKHARDDIPDVGVDRVAAELLSVPVLRMAMSVYLSYRPEELPLSFNWGWLALEIALYSITVDFFFYWYHRLMHSVPILWKFHRTHHLTKHPHPLLGAYADHEQEFMDMMGVPLLAYATLKLMGLPMSFYEWYICYQYVAFSEIIGHSGLRVHGGAPSTINWLLEALDADLVIEDHDLHHRYGWRNSHNYGKQSRVWDRVFGTCRERIEGHKGNVDYENRVTFPLF
ncbi:hypothetical protein ANOM_000162 [Aspergillus nomiae NRRL 13137]|uniref:Fatty acid hydroxylase domain-containing protein n=1 Tax=Aspergillus nomiae NRRL (strain ATCC 15546 / NRRL 13137 / CBS 260.88 / M93) TaxID=1509407 RepID=A0A0L1JIR7_ASPN3|nr:uncharacterized protein ANOM_000162 [Aspergillus nomiae NRRL 13137]KNG91597.1 hypothetical protein ANOM_000162 [Aspergillus nomiae NRRL 13137]